MNVRLAGEAVIAGGTNTVSATGIVMLLFVAPGVVMVKVAL